MIPVILADPTVVADFSNEPLWMSIVKALVIVVYLILSVLVALWVERSEIARLQHRIGPRYGNGPKGWFQALGDALKLVLKEDVTVSNADKFIYIIAPMISVFASLLVYAVLPFGPTVTIGSVTTPLQMTDVPVAVLYILACAAIGVYGILLGGWASNSPYPLLGAVRSSAQVISYELAMGLSIVSVFLLAGSMSTSGIVEAQTNYWFAIPLLPAFILYVISMFGEVNRLPFDLPEGEGELVAGYHTEYSSMKFAWYYLAEYINMVNVSGVATTLFLGGWRAPWPLSAINDGMFNTGAWPVLWFVAKVWLFMFFFVWVRGTLLRFRYDQFMKFGWKVLIPFGLAWFVAVALVQGVRQFTEIPTMTLIAILAGVLAVALVASLLIPDKPEPEAPRPADLPFDAFAAGHPVPPLPGQQMAPSKRNRLVSAAVPSELPAPAQEAGDE
jgi:NADH-quinone oxidoreductase subunit H